MRETDCVTAVAFDSATPVMGVCVSTPRATVVCSLAVGLEHGTRLAPLVAGALQQAGATVDDLDLVVCGIGPGSFTGTRIGIAIALGMTAGGRGLIGVSGLDAAGHRLRFFPGIVVPLIDARKGRLFAALYRAGRRLTGFLDESPDRIRERLRAYPAVLLTGPAAPGLHAAWGEDGGIALDPDAGQADAAALLEVGVRRFSRQAVRRVIPRPAYLRPSEAELGRPGPSPPAVRGLPMAGAESDGNSSVERKAGMGQ